VKRRSAVLAVMVAAMQPALAGPCAPRAHLDGDAEAVARVTAALASLGIEVGATRGDGCPVVVAAVELDRGGGIAVAVRDGTNRSEGRVVSDAALAAAWIDSWIHDDFAPAAVPALSPPSSAPAVPARVPVDAPPTAVSVLDRFAVDAGYVQTFALDGSGGSGFAGGACVRAGALCVGARVHALKLDVPAGATRDDLAVTATASWSHALGNVVIAPELEAGVGKMATDACPPPPCDPTTMMCMPAPSCTNAGVQQATYTPRVGASLRASLPVFAHVWLEGTAAITVAPFGHGDPFPGQTDPNGMMPGTIPGEPAASAQLGVGVRVGLP